VSHRRRVALISYERAVRRESAVKPERFVAREGTRGYERAGDEESIISPERADERDSTNALGASRIEGQHQMVRAIRTS
jgi:hypothetical protein